MINSAPSWHRVLALAAIGLSAIINLATARSAELHRSWMGAHEIKLLEQRLSDAGCYHGVIDGQESSALDEAINACPDQRPFLRVETGMHTDWINGISADADCRVLATASHDKTLRLWSIPDGQLLHTLRLPIGGGRSGQLFSTAVSPDGQLVAVARADHFFHGDPESAAVYLYNIHNPEEPKLVRRTVFGSRPLSFAFSGDGTRLAIGFKGPQAGGVSPGTQGVRVTDVISGREILSDSEYASDVNGLAFAPDGSLIASSFDGRLRRYGPDMKISVNREALEGGKPSDVAIDPSGRLTAVGYAGKAAVSILDTVTLNPLFNADLSGLSTDGLAGVADLQNVAWSSDGITLLAGGQARGPIGQGEGALLRLFDSSGHRSGPDIVVPGTVADVARCGDGFVFDAGSPTVFGLISAQGEEKILQGPRGAAMRGKVGAAFTLRADASAVRFGLGEGEESAIIFDVNARSLVDSPMIPSDFVLPRIDGLSISDWHYSTDPKLNGVKLPLEVNEESHALAARPDLSGFALGTWWNVRAYSSSGEQLWAHPGHTAVSGVNISADGEIVAVAYDDGTIRWLRWSDGQELLALFVEPMSRKWVAWTPSGYYMASAGGEDLIGWQINRGWEQEADFFAASQFRAEYNRPDVVQLILQTRDEAAAIRQANARSGRKVAAAVADGLPPVVKIVSPTDLSLVAKSPIEVTYLVRSPTPVTGITALVDSRPVPTAAAKEIMSSPDGVLASVTIDMPQHNAVISLVATNQKASSEPAVAHIGWQGAKDWYKPDLYVLAVGVSKYNDKTLNLTYPDKDADDFVKVMQEEEGGLYNQVYVRELDDDQATRDEIRKGLSWLKKSTTSRDIAMLFLSGHGQGDAGGHYHYLPYDSDLSDLDLTTIQDYEIEDFLGKVPGKVLAFLDTCFSGGLQGNKGPSQADIDKLANELASSDRGVVVFTSSTGRQFSLEKPDWSNGAFTKALVEAFKGGADYDHEKTISIAALELYLDHRVKELTDGEQSPMSTKPKTIENFVIGTVVQ
jgi:WD40 repeat protein